MKTALLMLLISLAVANAADVEIGSTGGTPKGFPFGC